LKMVCLEVGGGGGGRHVDARACYARACYARAVAIKQKGTPKSVLVVVNVGVKHAIVIVRIGVDTIRRDGNYFKLL